MEEEDNGVVASSDSATTKPVTGHEVIIARERSTTDAARRKRVRRDPETKTTGHAEQAVGHKILRASGRSGKPKGSIRLRERKKMCFEDVARVGRNRGGERMKQTLIAKVGEGVL